METLKGLHVVWGRGPHLAAVEQDGGHDGLIKHPRNGWGYGVLGNDFGDAAPHPPRP